MRRVFAAFAALALMFTTAPPQAALALASDCESITGNLVLNCGFESHTPLGTNDSVTWTSWSDSSSDGWVYMQPGTAHSGTYGLSGGPSGGTEWIEQALGTTAGATYRLQFYLSSYIDPAQIATFSATLDGTTAYSRSNADPVLGGWTLVEHTFTASDSSTALRFTFRNDPGWWYLDDVSLTIVDSTAPTITPRVKIKGTNVTVTWTTSETATVECKLDDASTWTQDCESPLSAQLPKGPHHLYLRATDLASNTGDVVDVTITVKSGKPITPN